MHLVHASISENKTTGKNGDAKAGDQTGKEVCIRSWYSKPWNVILRYPNVTLAKNAANAAVKLANSNLIGYDQTERNSLYRVLKSFHFNIDEYIKSGIKTETDCSAFIYAVYCCFIPAMRSDNNAPVTSTMRGFYKRFCFSVETDLSCLNGDNLRSGDIVLKEGSHTAMVVNDDIESNNIITVSIPEIRRGSAGKSVKAIQSLLSYYGFSVGSCSVAEIFSR